MGVAQYSIQTNFGAKDNVSPTFTRMTKSASVFQSRLNGLSNAGKTVKNSIGKLAGLGASLFAFNKIKTFGEQAVELAQKQITAEENLQQVLKNNVALRAKGKDAYKGATADLINFAGELQKKGVIGDEVTIAGMQTLASSGLSVENIKRLTGPMNDLIAHHFKLNSTQENAEAVAKGLSRAIYGNAGALAKMDIYLSDTEKKMFKNMTVNQRLNLITKKLNNTIGGTNAILAKSDLGAKQQALNNLGDTMENIGKRLIPVQGAFFRTVNKHLPKLEKLIDKTFKTAEYVIRQTMPAWKKLGETVKYIGDRVFTEFSQHGGTLKNVFEKVIVPGINLTADAIYGLTTAFFGVYDFVKEHWVTIESFLLILGSAKLAGGIMAVANAMKALNTANIIGLLTSSNLVWNGLIGTWANIEYLWRTGLLPTLTSLKNSAIGLNLVLNAQLLPTIGRILLIGGGVGLLISLLVGAAYWLWKNWDSVTQWCEGAWLKIQTTAKKVCNNIGQWVKTHIIDIFTLALGPIGLVARGLYEVAKRLNLINGAEVSAKSDINLSAKYPEPPMAKNVTGTGNITIGFDKNSANALEGATPFVSSIKATNMNLSPA